MVPHVAARKTHQRLSKFSFVTPKRLLQQYPAESGSELHSIGAAVETAFTLTLQSEYPTATQQERTRPYVMMCNLSNINTAMRGGLMELIEVRLMCVGCGPTLDYADAMAFLAAFQPMIDMARKRRLQ
jgi:hypothetical protein